MTVASCPSLIDTHAHLQDQVFDDDREALLERAWAAGLIAIVCVGYDLASSRRAVRLADSHARLFAAVGIHPNHAGQADRDSWSELQTLARHPKVVGLGETGLDNYREHTPPDVQRAWFRRHIELAADRRLPLIVHNRQADADLSETLRECLSDSPGLDGRPMGVMHCFSADEAMLETSLALGFMISLAGPITYKSAEPLRMVARQVPADRLVVETDCPYLAPQSHRGERNEPAFVKDTARQLATVRQVPFEELAESTTRAACSLFGLRVPC